MTGADVIVGTGFTPAQGIRNPFEDPEMKHPIRFLPLLPVLLALSSSALADKDRAEGLPPIGNSPPILHIDPLDESRASAMHRGPNPHRALTPFQHMEVAAQHLQAQRIPQALATLSQALSQYPENAELYNMRAGIERGQNDIGSALADMEQAVRLAPDNPLYLMSRAQLYLQFQRSDEALKDFDRAVELAPDSIPVRFNRGALLANLGREADALKDFNRIIELQPKLPASWFNRGAMNHALGHRTQARQDIQTFIELSAEPKWQQAGRDLLKAWDEEEAKRAAAGKPGPAQ